MNYFAHGRPFLSDPYFLAGTAVPDWLGVVNRKVRVRTAPALRLSGDDDWRHAAVARGIAQHFHDDAWFHNSRAFAELSLEFCRQLKAELGSDDGMRPHFVGHIAVEMLLDAALIAEEPRRLEAYYAALTRVDPRVVQAAVDRIAPRPASGLANFIPAFSRERFLWNYLDNDKLLWRLNQVMQRVRLPLLPASIGAWLGRARAQVIARRRELLTPPPQLQAEAAPPVLSP